MSVAGEELKRRAQRLIDEAVMVYQDQRAFDSWLIRVEMAMQDVGPRGAALIRAFDDIKQAYGSIASVSWAGAYEGYTTSTVDNRDTVQGVLPILDAMIAAVDEGLLIPIEDLIASDVYGDVFAEARVLLHANHLDCAAILLRIGVENALKRRAQHEAMLDVDKAKAQVVNDWLWKKGVYPKGDHDTIEGWLALGNAFAHDTPDKRGYTHSHVAKAIDDSQVFVTRL